MPTRDPNVPVIDASKFPKEIISLAETMAQKVKRELPADLEPPYLGADLFVLIRHAKAAFRFVTFVNADEHRSGPGWTPEHTIHSLSAIRTLIDCLYNLAAILEDIPNAAVRFRVSGFNILLKRQKEEEERYANDPEREAYLRAKKHQLYVAIIESGFSVAGLPQGKWLTLGNFLGPPNANEDNLRSFLRMFTLGSWREYSNISHASFEGFSEVGATYIDDHKPHAQRMHKTDYELRILTMHYCRAALLLLCVVIEVQAKFRFVDDAHISERIHAVWRMLEQLYEAKEVRHLRYDQLMLDAGIHDYQKVGSLFVATEMPRG